MRVSSRQSNWVEITAEAIRLLGYCIVENTLDTGFTKDLKRRMKVVHKNIFEEVGEEKLQRAGEIGVLRLMLKFDKEFIKLLEIPEVVSIVDKVLSPTAILHLQNGLILHPQKANQARVFQNTFHRDFPRNLNGYLMSLNTFFAIDDFTSRNGATLCVPNTHQKEIVPSKSYISANAIPIICPSGTMIVFDSTLLHSAGINRSKSDRIAINQQFTWSYIKQQIDYPRALGESYISMLRPRTQQILGWYTRTPANLDEFYRPEEARLYRRGQG